MCKMGKSWNINIKSLCFQAFNSAPKMGRSRSPSRASIAVYMADRNWLRHVEQYAVPRQIKPRILDLGFRRGQIILALSLFFVKRKKTIIESFRKESSVLTAVRIARAAPACKNSVLPTKPMRGWGLRVGWVPIGKNLKPRHFLTSKCIFFLTTSQTVNELEEQVPFFPFFTI